MSKPNNKRKNRGHIPPSQSQYCKEGLNKLYEKQQEFLNSELDGIKKIINERQQTSSNDPKDKIATSNKRPILENDYFDIDKDGLIERAKDLSRENLKILYGIVKVIGLTTATIVLLNILLTFEEQPFDFSKIKNWYPISIWNWHWCNSKHELYDIKIFFWTTSCMVLILTYDAAMFATIFLYRIVRNLDILLIFLFVGFEFFLFAVLYPNFFIENKNMLFPHFASWWLIIYGGYTICIGILAWRTVKNIGATKFYDPKITHLLKEHYSHDFLETRSIGSISILIGLLDFIPTNPADIKNTRTMLILSIALTVLIFLAFFGQYSRRKIITDIFIQEPERLSNKETRIFVRNYERKLKNKFATRFKKIKNYKSNFLL